MKGSSTGEHFDSAYKLQAQLGSGASFCSLHCICITSYKILFTLCVLTCKGLAEAAFIASSSSSSALHVQKRKS
jgi:hypothetical protein